MRQGIYHIDQSNNQLKKTLRELIMELLHAHFLNIDLNWSNSGCVMIHPTKHEEITQEPIANLGPYLHKAYGDSTLK